MGGGGARGAYEAGVLSALSKTIFPRFTSPPEIEIFVGTSVGAINALYLASFADRMSEGLETLEDVWGELNLENILVPSSLDSFSFLRWLFGRSQKQQVGFVNPTFLRNEITSRFPWQRIDYLVDMEYLQTICMPATHLRSGRIDFFIQTNLDELPNFPEEKRVQWNETAIRPDHAFASSALPLFFPAKEINGQLYCDGGLRQNMPITPAILLGGKKILTIGVKKEVPWIQEEATFRIPEGRYPSAPDLFGKMMDAILLDPLERESSKIQLLKELLDEGKDQFGPKFANRMGDLLGRYIGGNLLAVDLFHQRPSMDLGKIAVDYIEAIREEVGGIWGRIFHSLAEGQITGDWDLASYMLFDHRYAEELIELGKQDVKENEQEYIEFFRK